MYTPHFYKDIERCPYAPSEPEWAGWIKKDQERLADIDRHRAALLTNVRNSGYLGSEYTLLRNMAQFVVEMLGSPDELDK